MRVTVDEAEERPLGDIAEVSLGVYLDSGEEVGRYCVIEEPELERDDFERMIRKCVAEALEEAEQRAKNAQQNFIWWASHREFCGWRLGGCDCGLTEAVRAEKPVDDEWFFRRMDAVRTAAGFNDDRERREFAEWCKERGLP